MTYDVLLLTNAVAPDKLGGLERYVRELAAALVRSGVHATVVAKRVLPHSPTVETGDDGVRLVRHDVPSKQSRLFALRYPWETWRTVRSVLHANPHAVLHGHFPLPLTTLVRPLLPAIRPFLYTFHAPVYKELLSERQGTYVLPEPVQRPVVHTLRQLEASIVSRASGVAVLSEFMRTELLALSPRTAAGASIIPGGVNTRWFTPDRSGHSPTPDPLLVTARRLTPRTGVGELVRAMTTVVARYPRARLAIAGDGNLRAGIERDIAAHALEKNVELLGRIGDDELRTWYRRATLTVMPTTELEGFGLSTAESLLCGTPVLVTPIGANPELVADLDRRFVAPAANADGLARGILALLDAPEALEAARHRLPGARATAWSWDSVAAQYMELYASRLGARR